jgi:hypothetical protein
MKRPAASTPFAGRTRRNADFDDRVTLAVHARSAPMTCVAEVTYGYDQVADAKRTQLADQSKLNAFFVASVPGSVAVMELSPAAFYPAATLLRDLPGVRAPPDWATPRTRPAVGFVDYSNRVMNGCSYRSVPTTDRDACVSACATDAACRGYSYNKISRACELKHTLTALRFDPLWTSGAPSPGPTPGRSTRAEVMVSYPANIDDAKGLRLVGKLIDDAKAESREECSARCKADQGCIAREYGETNGACRRFSEVTGSRSESSRSPAPLRDEEVFTVEIKKQ